MIFYGADSLGIILCILATVGEDQEGYDVKCKAGLTSPANI